VQPGFQEPQAESSLDWQSGQVVESMALAMTTTSTIGMTRGAEKITKVTKWSCCWVLAKQRALFFYRRQTPQLDPCVMPGLSPQALLVFFCVQLRRGKLISIDGDSFF